MDPATVYLRLVFMALLLCINGLASAALDWSHVNPRQLGPRTWVVEHGPHEEPKSDSHGFHNNPGFVVTDDGIVVIDTGSSVEIGRMLLTKIAEVSDKPVTHVFTTHFHGDHWLGNQAIVEAYPNVHTIAHPEAIRLLGAGEDAFWVQRFSELLGDDFAGTRAVIPASAASEGELTIGGVRFDILLFDKAHTATDLMVYVRNDGVLFTGDVVNNAHCSFMGHGNFHGAIEATRKAASLRPSHVVAGHGKSGGAELVDRYDAFYAALVAKVQHHYDAGLEDYEMKPLVMKELQEYRNWHNFDVQLGPYISQVILEIESGLPVRP